MKMTATPPENPQGTTQSDDAAKAGPSSLTYHDELNTQAPQLVKSDASSDLQQSEEEMDREMQKLDTMLRLEEKKAAIKAKRTRLHMLQAERLSGPNVLRDSIRDSSQLGVEDIDRAASIPQPPKRPASTEAPGHHVKRSTLKPKNPKVYTGQDIKAHSTFLRQCNMAFIAFPSEFPTSRDKAVWAAQYIEGSIGESWWQHVESMQNHQDITWEMLQKFLLDGLADPVNRTLDAYLEHNTCRQSREQTVQDFVTHLTQVESRLPAYTEEQKVGQLFAKLRPEIRHGFLNYHTLPRTRTELVSLTSTIEKNLARSQRHATNKSQAPAKHDKGKQPDYKNHEWEFWPYSRETPVLQFSCRKLAPPIETSMSKILNSTNFDSCGMFPCGFDSSRCRDLQVNSSDLGTDHHC